jgi:hypothetical protein
VKLRDFEYSDDIYGYVSLAGVLPFNGTPKRLSAIHGMHTKLDNVNEYEALLLTMSILENKKQSLEQWLTEVIDNKQYRFKLHKNLKKIALKPKSPNWEIIDVKSKGDLVI